MRSSPLVDQVHQVIGSDRLHIGDTEDETDSIEDIRLAGPVETRDGVERFIEA